MTLERIQVVIPQSTKRREPSVELLQRLCPDAINAPLRVDSGFDKPGVAQHAQVLRDGGLRESKTSLQIADGKLISNEEGENCSPGGFGKHVEGELHIQIRVCTYIPVEESLRSLRSLPCIIGG